MPYSQKNIQEVIDAIEEKWAKKIWSDFLVSCFYVFCESQQRHRKWWQKKTRDSLLLDFLSWEEIFKTSPFLLENWCQNFFLNLKIVGISGKAYFVLEKWQWCEKYTNIPSLCSFISTPEQVLENQVKGQRPLAILFSRYKKENAHLPVLNKKDVFNFFLHDLEHAANFFQTPEVFLSQKKFFKRIKELKEGHFFENLKKAGVSSHKLDYLISDMNSHWVHMLSFLKGTVEESLSSLQVRNQFWQKLREIWELNFDSHKIFLKINSEKITQEEYFFLEKKLLQ